MISVDKTDGFQIYLSKESIGADIVTAKVSEVSFCLYTSHLICKKINVMIPDENGEYLERPVVEQFRTYWNAEKKLLITEPVEIAA